MALLAIKGGHLLTGDEITGPGEITIFIENQQVVAMGKDLVVPEGFKVIDALGKYITAGFIDAHTHIGLAEEIYRVEGDDVNETSDPITPQLQALDGINFADLAFSDALKGGVTRALSMPGSANIIGGQAVFLKSLAANMSAMVYKNPFGLKAALGENPKRVYGELKRSPFTRMANAGLLREALYNAAKKMDKKDKEQEDDFKLLSIFKVLTREMPLLVHAHRADDILTALRLKDEFQIDIIIQHATEALLVADELVKREVPVFLGPLLVNRAKVEMKEISFTTPAALARRGVKFALTTDHPVIPIEHLRVCVALAVREGLDEHIALSSITKTPAEILKVDHEIGSIAVGKQADVVIFDGHPLEFRSRVHQVVVDGQLWEA